MLGEEENASPDKLLMMNEDPRSRLLVQMMNTSVNTQDGSHQRRGSSCHEPGRRHGRLAPKELKNTLIGTATGSYQSHNAGVGCLMVLDTSMASMNTKRVDLGHLYASQDTQDQASNNPKKDVMRRLYQSKKVEEEPSSLHAHQVDSPQFSYIQTDNKYQEEQQARPQMTRFERLQEFFMNDFTQQDMSHIRPLTTEGNDYSNVMDSKNSQGGLIHLQPVAQSHYI